MVGAIGRGSLELTRATFAQEGYRKGVKRSVLNARRRLTSVAGMPKLMNSQSLTAVERAALELMLQAPEVVEVHGLDKSWQQALSQVTAPAQPKPSLHEALRDVFQWGSAPAPDAPRG